MSIDSDYEILRQNILSLIPAKRGGIKEFAEKIGVPANLVSMWKNDKSVTSFKNYVHIISQAYNVSVDWLYGKEQQKKPIPLEGDELDFLYRYLKLKPEEREFVAAMVGHLLEKSAND